MKPWGLFSTATLKEMYSLKRIKETTRLLSWLCRIFVRGKLQELTTVSFGQEESLGTSLGANQLPERSKMNLCPHARYQRGCESFRAKLDHFSASFTDSYPLMLSKRHSAAKTANTPFSICPSCRRNKMRLGFQGYSDHISCSHSINLLWNFLHLKMEESFLALQHH